MVFCPGFLLLRFWYYNQGVPKTKGFPGPLYSMSVYLEKEREDSRFKKIVRISIAEGIFGQIFNSLSGPGSAFLTKFAIMIHATPFQFAILAAIGQISLIFQPLGAMITRRREKRKGTVLKLLFAGRGVALFFGIIPFVFPGSSAIWAFLLLLFLSVSLSAVANNAWIAWISNTIPVRMRGRFFSIRSRYLMLTAIAVTYIFSLFIDRFAETVHSGRTAFLFMREHLSYGFAIIFFIATIAGVSGLGLLARQPERTKRIEEESFYKMFVQPMKDSNFRRFLLYGCWWMLAVGIGAPFWQPFMMQKLQMSLFEVQLYGSINIISSISVLGLWGKFIDIYGNKTAMRFIILLGGINPMVWLFVSAESYSIIYLEAVTSGIMWGGAGLVGTNFVLSIAPREREQMYAGVSGAFSGIAMMTTMLISGVLLPGPVTIKGLHLEPEQVLFALTGIARWSAQIPLSWIHEPRSRPVGEALSSFIREIRPKIMK
jgi:MFS family permease